MIRTKDRELLSDLRAEGFPDLHLAFRAFTCDSQDWVPAVEKIYTYIFETANTISLSLLSNWLYERLQKKKPEQLIINDITLIDNNEIFKIINNYIQRADEDKNECDQKKSD